MNGVSGCEQHARRERRDGITEPLQKNTYLYPHTTTVKEPATEAARPSPDQMSSQPLLPAGDPRLIAVGFGVEWQSVMVSGQILQRRWNTLKGQIRNLWPSWCQVRSLHQNSKFDIQTLASCYYHANHADYERNIFLTIVQNLPLHHKITHHQYPLHQSPY